MMRTLDRTQMNLRRNYYATRPWEGWRHAHGELIRRDNMTIAITDDKKAAIMCGLQQTDKN